MFKKGQSGNPAGRPKGARDKRLALMLSNEKALQRKLVKMALGGDVAAMRIIADRLWTRLRPEAAPVRVSAASSGLAQQGAAIIDAALSGALTPDVLRDLMAALADQARLVEFAEFEERLQRLEGREPIAPWERLADGKFPIRGRKRRAAV